MAGEFIAGARDLAVDPSAEGTMLGEYKEGHGMHGFVEYRNQKLGLEHPGIEDEIETSTSFGVEIEMDPRGSCIIAEGWLGDYGQRATAYLADRRFYILIKGTRHLK